MSHSQKIIFNKGFTLFELLIVAGLIGILLAVFYAYLGESRDKGADGAVKQNILNARTQAEVYYTANNKSYLGLCNDSNLGIYRHLQKAAEAQNLVRKIAYSDGTASKYNVEQCNDTVSAYAAWVPLKTTNYGPSRNGHPVGLCIDSKNVTKIVDNQVLAANATQCP